MAPGSTREQLTWVLARGGGRVRGVSDRVRERYETKRTDMLLGVFGRSHSQRLLESVFGALDLVTRSTKWTLYMYRFCRTLCTTRPSSGPKYHFHPWDAAMITVSPPRELLEIPDMRHPSGVALVTNLDLRVQVLRPASWQHRVVRFMASDLKRCYAVLCPEAATCIYIHLHQAFLYP